MDQSELKTLLADLEELKRAVKRNNPFLREVISNRFFSAISLPLGLSLVAFCAGTQVLVAGMVPFPRFRSNGNTRRVYFSGFMPWSSGY